VLTPSASTPVAVLLIFEVFGIVAIALGIGIIVTRRVPWLLQEGLVFKSRQSPPRPTRTGGVAALGGGTIVLRASAWFPSVPHPVAVALTAASFITFTAAVACKMFVKR
jgi:hypothetical protein